MSLLLGYRVIPSIGATPLKPALLSNLVYDGQAAPSALPRCRNPLSHIGRERVDDPTKKQCL